MSVQYSVDLTIAEKRELLRRLLLRKGKPGDQLVPLSHGQSSLWFVHQLAPASAAYNFVYAARIGSAIDLDAFRRAFEALSRQHPMLRATFEVIGRKAFHRIGECAAHEFQVIDASGWHRDDLLRTIREEAHRPFDLLNAPALRIALYRRSPHETVLSLVVHHIIADLWSMDIVLRDLRTLYLAERAGCAGELAPPKAQYADFVRWQTHRLAGPEGQKAWEFWREALSGELPLLGLPTDRPRPPVQTYRGDVHDWALPIALSDRIRALAARQKVTPFIVLLSAFQVLLHRITGQDDLILGTATAGRGRPEWEDLVGYCLNPLPLRVRIDPTVAFSAFLAQVHRTVLQALEHQDYPFGLLVEKLQPVRDPSRPPIFQSMFIWNRMLGDAPSQAGPGARTRHDQDAFALEPLLIEQCGAPFDLTLILFESDRTLHASLRYNTDLFDASTIARTAGQLVTILESITDTPDERIAELPLLTPEERRSLLASDEAPASNRPERPFPRLFEDQAERAPEATAVVCEARSLSYGELNRRANQLARHLRRLGVRSGRLVGICLTRSIEMIVAVLGVWKAGAAYVPLDPNYPNRRLADMIEDARPAVILTHGAVVDRLPHFEAATVRLDADWPEIATHGGEDLGANVGPDDPSYVIFTSGTTGKPKGVLLCHRGLSNLVEAQRDVFGITPEDRVLLFSSPSFDASIFEMVMPLSVGAVQVVVTQSSILPGPDLAQLIRDEAVTTVTLPPSILAHLPRTELPALRTIIVAGEACPAEVVAAWAPGRRFFNAYGPTEATVWSTVARCQTDGLPPPIGRPIRNTRVYVLDPHLQLVPIGVPGELHIAGPGIARGYLNRPELTVEKFIPNPFDDRDDGVLYKTGDRVRVRPDGQIEFLGRIDQQVKIRGYRIEPEEIRAALRQHPVVRDAVVVVQPLGPCAAPGLVAYVVPDVSGTFPANDLKTYLRERLPHFMVPSAIMPLAALPLTRNGKIDREALPLPDGNAPRNGRALGAPRDETERHLVEVWAEVLKVDSLGIHDNFFDLGGASLQALEVVTLARKLGLGLTPEMLFQSQTIAELALRCRPIDETRPLVATEAAPRVAPRPEAPKTVATPTDRATSRTVIESFGVYLPPRVVSTAEVVRGCRSRLEFPLERMTGIRSRRMAGETEFAIDLAEKAVIDCLDRSACEPKDIDLLICCNISRIDGPDFRFTYEPTTASRLQRRFGLEHALAFDISNACAGTFTAIVLADAFLETGRARHALIVSGEYISHLTETAQKEITDFVDPRIACLTVGDSGVAIVLGRTQAEGVGFHELDLFTLGKYSGLCVAKATDQPHGGAIMMTDAIKSSAVTINQAVGHALGTLKRRGWEAESVDQIIMHQTSETTLDGAVREINELFGRSVCDRGNTIYNLAERGNTATNSHFVALGDAIQAGVIRPGARILFGVSGSGQTVGTALYTFDDLPERLLHPRPRAELARPACPALSETVAPRVRIESLGTIPHDRELPRDSLAMIREAAGRCLGASRYRRDEVGLIIHTGIYRNDFLSEPAMAAIAAGALEINHDGDRVTTQRTLAFDLMNGGAGTLDACHVATEMIRAGKTTLALILAAEIENNAHLDPEHLIGLKETGSALLLEPSTGLEGFGRFVFRSFPTHTDELSAHTVVHDGAAALRHEQSPRFERHLIEGIRATVAELLGLEGLSIDTLGRVFPPHRSRAFVAELADALGLPLERFILLPDEGRDYFTSSLAATLEAARSTGLVRPGDIGLLIAAGAGVQVGCATYYFG